MAKFFNVNGACRPDIHYMVDIEPKLREIRAMIDGGQYFTINRARQYGKTTTLRALAEYLKKDYTVVSLDFQKTSSLDFENEAAFVHGMAREVSRRAQRLVDVPEKSRVRLQELADEERGPVKMAGLFQCFSDWCEHASRPVILLVDEVDTASNNQVFLDFLAQLRADYLDNDNTSTFQSVILASVYDIRNIRRKLRPDEEHKTNSPWNIAARFRVNMSFSAEEIAGTEDFPDKKSAWTQEGLIEAEKLLLAENNTLFQSFTGKLIDYPQLRSVLYGLLFTGKPIPYVPQNQYIDVAAMFGFIKNDNGTAVILMSKGYWRNLWRLLTIFTAMRRRLFWRRPAGGISCCF